jgi:dephospho-CoA kinase
MNKNLLSIGLTGCRFSGKDVVSKLFRQLGVPVFDADVVVKYLLNYRDSMPESVRKAFGLEYVFGEYINPIAFDTDEKFSSLIDLIEFEVFESYDRFCKKHKDNQYTIFHSSIIHEKNWSKKFDRVICVFTPKDVRIERYKRETGDRLETIWSIFNKEMNETHKNQMSDFIIHNYEDAPDILKQVKNVDDKIVDVYLEKYYQLKRKIEVEKSDFDKQSIHKNIYTV